MFNEAERAYIESQRLLRLATVEPDGQPDNDAVGFQFDGERFSIVGMALERSRKYKNVAAGQTKVCLIVDDVASTDPWRPRGIKIHGVAALGTRETPAGPRAAIIVTPTVSWSWGLVGENYSTMHKTVWTPR